MKRFLRRPANFISSMVLLSLVVIMLLANLIATHDPIKQDLSKSLSSPTAENWLGADKQGRDTFSRLVHGARPSLLGALGVVFISVLMGVPLGLVAGFYGGRVDNILMRVVDVLLAFPALLLAILIVSTFGRNLFNSVLALGVVYIPALARVVRSVALQQRQQIYIEAAHALGAGNDRILARHMLPNVLTPIIVHASLDFGYAILDIAALSFLGLGMQPPNPDWGSMLSDGRAYLLLSPYVSVFAGLAIMLTVIALNVFGDGLRMAFDPKQR